MRRLVAAPDSGPDGGGRGRVAGRPLSRCGTRQRTVRARRGVPRPATGQRGPLAAPPRSGYRTLNPSEIDLDFAGRLTTGHRALQSLNRIAAGNPVSLEQAGDRRLIVDRHGIVIERLARKFAPPEGATFVEGSVYAITTRFRSDSSEDFRSQFRRDRWSVVLPELVYRS